jgi:uncharacterized protein (TIGR04255 family)
VRPIGSTPLAPPFRLRNDQLAQVLCQIRFSTILRIRKDDEIVDFQEALRDRYPRYSKRQGIQVLITPTGVQQQETPDSQHRFDDTDGKFTVVLTPDFVALETTQYTDIEDFAARIVELAQAVETHYRPAEVLRVGLRFINELRLMGARPQEEMRSAINSTVLGATGSEELFGVVTNAQQVLELTGENSRILMRHGLNAGGTTVDPIGIQGPRPEWQHPFYLLDFDAFAEQATPYDLAGVDAKVRDFNDDIRSLFAWAVRDDYRRDVLGQEDLA